MAKSDTLTFIHVPEWNEVIFKLGTQDKKEKSKMTFPDFESVTHVRLREVALPEKMDGDDFMEWFNEETSKYQEEKELVKQVERNLKDEYEDKDTNPTEGEQVE